MLRKSLVAVFAASIALVACGGSTDTGGGGSSKIVMGCSQGGSESGWRTANTVSIKKAAADAGVDLKFSDAQQKQENQIAAIRSFIQQKVTVIAFSPVVVSGWDTVLKEAKDAKIPVILTDRAVDSQDTTLYKTFIGSDFIKEGRLSGEWLVAQDFVKSASGPINIVQIEGTVGAAPAIDRKKGFGDGIAGNPNLKIIDAQSGDFTRSGGKKVMEAFLKKYPKIDVLFAHNDDEGLGAIEAITAAGKVPGKDIKIITIDAVRDGMQALADGKFNFIAECSPLLGPQLMDIAKKVVAGQSVPQRIVTEETTFTPDQAKTALPTRQ